MKSGSRSGNDSCHESIIGKKGGKKGGNIQIKSLAPLYLPKTPMQSTYVQYLKDPLVKIVLGVGPAGCGKTLFACSRAIEDLKNGVIQKIILTRPLISVDEESVGFLPGTMNQKMDPWTRPIFDIFAEYYSANDMQALMNSGAIEVSPLAYMRGRTFKRAFIIADEMQNSSPNQMLMLTTRLGDDTKLVITGDLRQSDRPPSANGLGDFIRRFRSYSSAHVSDGTSDIQLVELGNEDILRSPIVAKIMDMYHGPERGVFSLSNHTLGPSGPSSTPSSSSSSASSSIPLTCSSCLSNHSVSGPCCSPSTGLCKDVSVLPDSKNKSKVSDSIYRSIIKNDAAIIPAHQVSKYFHSYYS
jgi:phosphate starvation-inducible PhoH-like protein